MNVIGTINTCIKINQTHKHEVASSWCKFLQFIEAESVRELCTEERRDHPID